MKNDRNKQLVLSKYIASYINVWIFEFNAIFENVMNRIDMLRTRMTKFIKKRNFKKIRQRNLNRREHNKSVGLIMT